MYQILGKYRPIYTDTDSALMRLSDYLQLKQDMPKLFELDENGQKKFGNLDLEEFGTANCALLLAAKNYFIWRDAELVKKGFKGVSLDRDVFLTPQEAFELLEQYDIKKSQEKNIER